MVYNLYPPLPLHNFYLDYASLEDDINEFDFVKQAFYDYTNALKSTYWVFGSLQYLDGITKLIFFYDND